MTLYTELKEAGCELDHHESDLYVLATTRAFLILRNNRVGFTAFINSVDGKRWFDVPFMYSPWWQAKS